MTCVWQLRQVKWRADEWTSGRMDLQTKKLFLSAGWLDMRTWHMAFNFSNRYSCRCCWCCCCFGCIKKQWKLACQYVSASQLWKVGKSCRCNRLASLTVSLRRRIWKTFWYCGKKFLNIFKKSSYQLKAS